MKEALFICGFDIIVNLISFSIQNQLQIHEDSCHVGKFECEFNLYWTNMIENVDAIEDFQGFQ